MRFATFNVNGISARLPRLLEWLAETHPDVVGLQEIKCEDDRFPAAEIEAAGYHAIVHGQKSFNGVAVLTRAPAEEIARSLPGDDTDTQARWLEVRAAGVHFCCLYLPNGNPAPGPKFDYKLAWIERMQARVHQLWQTEAPVILAGDWNVCPTDADLARPETMQEDAICRPETRAAFRKLQGEGWTDALLAARPDDPGYTFWDYQAGAWPKNWGMRIDHLLLSPAAADRMTGCGVDRAVRGRERPSDHVPVWIELTDDPA